MSNKNFTRFNTPVKFPFNELPLECKIYVFRNADVSVFQKLFKLKELHYLTQTNQVERIYRERCEKWYPAYILKFKPEDMKWKTFYNRMEKFLPFCCMKEVASHITCPLTGIDECLIELKILYDLFVIGEKDFIVPQDNIDYFAGKGKTHILEWFIKEPREMMPTTTGAMRAACYNHINVLNLLGSYNIYPEEDHIPEIVSRGGFGALKWMHERNIHANTIVSQRSANIAACRNRIDILEWLRQEHCILPTHLDVYICDVDKYKDVLNWFIEKDVKMNSHIANEVAVNGGIKGLNWLYNNYNILPTQDAGRGGYICDLNARWLREHGIQLSIRTNRYSGDKYIPQYAQKGVVTYNFNDDDDNEN